MAAVEDQILNSLADHPNMTVEQCKKFSREKLGLTNAQIDEAGRTCLDPHSFKLCCLNMWMRGRNVNLANLLPMWENFQEDQVEHTGRIYTRDNTAWHFCEKHIPECRLQEKRKIYRFYIEDEHSNIIPRFVSDASSLSISITDMKVEEEILEPLDILDAERSLDWFMMSSVINTVKLPVVNSHIKFSKSTLTKSMFCALGNMSRNLRTITLVNCDLGERNGDIENLSELIAKQPQLEKLELNYNPKLGSSLDQLRLPNGLKQLYLEGCGIENSNIGRLNVVLENLLQLKILDISKNRIGASITDLHWKSLAETLEEIYLWKCVCEKFVALLIETYGDDLANKLRFTDPTPILSQASHPAPT